MPDKKPSANHPDTTTDVAPTRHVARLMSEGGEARNHDLRCGCGYEWTEYVRPNDLAPMCPACHSEAVTDVSIAALDAVRRSPDMTEIEAAIVRALDELHNDMGLHTRTIVAAKRAALDAVRRSPQGEVEAAARKVLDTRYSSSLQEIDEALNGLEAALDAVRRSPQGEDHEVGMVCSWCGLEREEEDDLDTKTSDAVQGDLHGIPARGRQSGQGEDHERVSQDHDPGRDD